ncbi:hypothetical protein BOTBODRAFT_649264 [Botryobasidium botryosum FD-172 SS1]|uniref:RING-type domain-containing protein n=1 Tax=Botryobasidium botryosum (strain FD-172 SS1) TaxID=930990 RepID=A0A067M6B3_BOTB1|nr:hypothetical protein BOTBODRAFT_649264 [Botryobasidium botryosum FD-172 SS1]
MPTVSTSQSNRPGVDEYDEYDDPPFVRGEVSPSSDSSAESSYWDDDAAFLEELHAVMTRREAAVSSQRPDQEPPALEHHTSLPIPRSPPPSSSVIPSSVEALAAPITVAATLPIDQGQLPTVNSASEPLDALRFQESSPTLSGSSMPSTSNIQPQKRTRSPSPNVKGKEQEKPDAASVLETYEEYMICPIVATQALVPCGHVMCGPCITTWINTLPHRNVHAECPSCRTRLSERPTVPSLHTDSMIEHHLNVLGMTGVGGWETNDTLDGEDGWGRKRREWEERWRFWRESQQRQHRRILM